MERHRALIAPKFQKLLDIFDGKLAHLPGVTWTRPKDGYFISLDVPLGCAQRVVALAKEAGIEPTPARATHPYEKDLNDCTIRIALRFRNCLKSRRPREEWPCASYSPPPRNSLRTCLHASRTAGARLVRSSAAGVAKNWCTWDASIWPLACSTCSFL